METNNQKVDSENTTQTEARNLLKALGEKEFSGDTGKLALALGREDGEIREILDGTAEIDEDLLMKIRGIAQQRDTEIQ